jgi:hypothetical protein
MRRLSDLSARDLEQLSAYIDRELTAKETARLEKRLQADRTMRWALNELKATANVIEKLPQVQPPRNLTLTAEMVGVPKRRNLYPIFRLATAIAAVAFALVVGTDAFLLSRFANVGMLAPAKEAISMMEEARGFEALEAPSEVDYAQGILAEPETLVEEAHAALGAGSHEDKIDGEIPPYESENALPNITGTIEEGQPTATSLEVSPSDVGQIDETVERAAREEEPCEERIPITEEAKGISAANEMTATMPSLPSATPTPERWVAKPSLSPLRLAEIGLGSLAVILAGLTLWCRRRF